MSRRVLEVAVVAVVTALLLGSMFVSYNAANMLDELRRDTYQACMERDAQVAAANRIWTLAQNSTDAELAAAYRDAARVYQSNKDLCEQVKEAP